ncbi:MJ1255/VC2487 family glycosyltransferase [Ferrimonas gelatinilytica]|uniref:Glycosyltransferase family protein n=1 Tax=Ferrimonas gelatinilytica TaxID=1255257 RepID=A0ABP9SFS0_9GAMM
MRILYGVQGTGNGHITRARVMADALERAGLEVDYLFSGRPREAFFDMAAFGDFRCKGGLSFVTRDGRIDLWQTLRQNRVWQWWRDVRVLDLSQYDLVLNDFEPISAWAARRQGKPCIGISHQNAFRHPVPVVGYGPINRLIMNYFAPTSVALGCHWHHFGCDLLPPVVEPLTPTDSNGRILVYLPFEETDTILSLLAQLPEMAFAVFHGSAPTQRVPGNVQWHGFSRANFQRELTACEGVIASAGFELASEALVLGKKLLLRPLKGQFEQQSNALALKLLGAGQLLASWDPDRVRQWRKGTAMPPVGYPPVGDLLVAWLQRGQWQETEGLCRRVWAQAKLPEAWQNQWAMER